MDNVEWKWHIPWQTHVDATDVYGALGEAIRRAVNIRDYGILVEKDGSPRQEKDDGGQSIRAVLLIDLLNATLSHLLGAAIEQSSRVRSYRDLPVWDLIEVLRSENLL